MNGSFLSRMDARDRALFTRWLITPTCSRSMRRAWTVITHLGGATFAILAILVPAAIGVTGRVFLIDALLVLVLSHLIVQAVKRSVGRPRPSRRTERESLVIEPDRFSFPSGHATAAMSVAFVYAAAHPAWALPLLGFAACVGFSRVRLGVHYPGDVLAGQVIAIATGAFVLAR